MTATAPESQRTISRRAALAAGATGASVGLSGCTDLLSQLVENRQDQVSLKIMTLPAEEDRATIQIARRLRQHLDAAGFSTELDIRTRMEFLSALLFQFDFDCCVWPLPYIEHPAALYSLFHSRFANEAGWQNPYGYANPTVDDYLETCKQETDPTQALSGALDLLTTEFPIIPLCRSEAYYLARTQPLSGWDGQYMSSKLGYLGLSGETDNLRVSVASYTPLRNLNPLAATARGEWPIVDLIYDSLVVPTADSYRQWLAADLSTTTNADTTTVTVTLRDNALFHGNTSYEPQPVQAEDVIFTYQLLDDITLGQAGSPFPAPNYRWASSLIETVQAPNGPEGRTVELEVNTTADMWWWALTPPILPKHIWRERLDFSDRLFDPISPWSEGIDDTIPPIGSGPYRVQNRSLDERLVLDQVADHFTTRDSSLPSPVAETLTIEVDPNQEAIINSIQNVENEDGIDVMAERFDTNQIETLQQISDNDVTAIESSQRPLYHIGFNTQRRPFSNWQFRRAFAGLLDPEAIVEEILYGHGVPNITPLPEASVPAAYHWDGSYPGVDFYGTNGDYDPEKARKAFVNAGYRYDSDGNLVIFQ